MYGARVDLPINIISVCSWGILGKQKEEMLNGISFVCV